jgi:hypothetical protein
MGVFPDSVNVNVDGAANANVVALVRAHAHTMLQKGLKANSRCKSQSTLLWSSAHVSMALKLVSLNYK